MSEWSETPERDLPDMLSVVVPALDCEAMIETQLDALAAQDYKGDWEVLVVDNGSTDGTVEVAKAYADRLPNLRIIDASSRRGVSHARNCGARAADGELILICDADDRVRPFWVRKMAEASRTLDIIGGYLDTKQLNDVETRAWRNPFSSKALPSGMLNHLPFAVGANVGVTRACFEAIDGWGEEYVCGGDDVDFSWRAQQAGFRLGMAPGAVIDYRYRAGAERPLPPVPGLRPGRPPRLPQPQVEGHAPERSGRRGAVLGPAAAAGTPAAHHPPPTGPVDPELRVPLGSVAGQHPLPLSLPVGTSVGISAHFHRAWLAAPRGASKTLRAETPPIDHTGWCRGPLTDRWSWCPSAELRSWCD